MQSVIDNIAAVVIGVTILFAVLALSTRSQDSSIEATQVDLAKLELRSLIDIVEQDFNNLGSGMGRPNATATERAVTMRGVESVSGQSFQTVKFYALESDTGAPLRALVTYRWRTAGSTVLANGTTVPLLEIQRESNGQTATFTNATDFGITLRYDHLTPLSAAARGIPDSLALVRYLDVDVSMASPAGPEALIEETNWSKRFRPVNLEPLSRRVIASPP